MPQSTRMALDSIIDLPKEEAEFLKLKSKQIPRFPSNLQRIGRERDFIAPRTVAIGPYYHGVLELQPMEKVKRIAVHYFFKGLAAGSWDATYEKIKLIAPDARVCYADKDALQGITDDKFAEIMFIDGCFLVQFLEALVGNSEGDFCGIMNPHGIGVMRDMMLLENQIPWLVMEVLVPFKSLEMKDIYVMVHQWLHGTKPDEHLGFGINEHYKPSHLLCLVRSYEAAGSEKTMSSSLPSGMEYPMYTSAAELAELGIRLEASQKRQISAINIAKEGFLCTKLMLAPLNLEAMCRCWLVNIAAFEMWSEWEECIVNSYLSVLSLLMHREEDVHELRVKRIVLGCSSDRQTLEFFNDLAPYLPEGQAYWRIIEGLQEYRQKRWVWIAIYRFVYKNSKTIATVLSIVGVLVGIFRTLLSLNRPPAH